MSRSRWVATVAGLAFLALAAWWLAPYVFSVYHLEVGASALEYALLPVYPDRLAQEQVVDSGKLVEAISHLGQALRWDGRNVQAQRLMARVYLSKGETTSALGALQAALAVRADNPLLWLELGDVYDNLGNTQAAIEAYEAGGVGSRTLPLAANYLGMAEFQLNRGNGEVAVDLWRKTLEIDPGNLIALCWLARIHRDLGDEENAAAYEEELKHIKADSVGVPLDFRMVEYQALATVWLVEGGTWESEALLAMLARHVDESGGELHGLMIGRELETILREWPGDEDVLRSLDELRARLGGAGG